MDHPEDPPDEFPVRVVGILNPQDFWIHQVLTEDTPYAGNPVIRAGIYGAFPVRSQYTPQKDELTIHKAKFWTPTSRLWFTNYIKDAKDGIVFAPKEIIDAQYSIDGISPVCMYGELYVYKNGVRTRVSKLLYNQRLAYRSYTQFDRYRKADRLPRMINTDEISEIVCMIKNEVPKFKISSYVEFRRQQMSVPWTVKSREQQVLDTKAMIQLQLRHCGVPMEEINRTLMAREEDWNLGCDSDDLYMTNCGREYALLQRMMAKEKKKMATERTVNVNELECIGSDDTEVVCEKYTVYPAGMPIGGQVIKKKGGTPNEKGVHTISTPENASKSFINSTDVTLNESMTITDRSEDSAHAVQSTSKNKSSESLPVNGDFTASDVESSYQNALKSGRSDESIVSAVAKTKQQNVHYTNDKIEVTQSASTVVPLNSFGVDTTKHSFEESFVDHQYEDRYGQKSQSSKSGEKTDSHSVDKLFESSSSPEAIFGSLSLKSCLSKPQELASHWVKHQDKDDIKKQAAEMKRLLGMADRTIEIPDNSCDQSKLNKTESEKSSDSVLEVVERGEEIDDSNIISPVRKFVILKTTFSDEENDPDIVNEDSFDQDSSSHNRSVGSFESGLSGMGSLMTNHLLLNPKSTCNLWSATQTRARITSINEDVSDTDLSFVRMVNCTSSPKEAKDDRITAVEKTISTDGMEWQAQADVEEIVRDVIKISEEVITTSEPDVVPTAWRELTEGRSEETGVVSPAFDGSMTMNALRDDSTRGLSGMRLMESIIEPKVMMHSQSVNISLWSSMTKTSFPHRIRTILSAMNVVKPNRLQTAVWPAMMRGHSVVVIGPAHSGKTLGILAPFCSSITDFEDVKDSRGPIGLIITPDAKTTHSNFSMCQELLRGAKVNGVHLKVLRVCSTGKYTLLKVYEGCDVLVMTSAAFLEFFRGKLPLLDLSRLKMLVFDDADVTYSQCNDDIDKIYSACCTDKSLRFQVALTAKKWMEQFRPLVKDFNIPIVCISAFQECVLYSKAELFVEMLLQDDKLQRLIDLLKKRAGISWKLVIVCINNEEVLEIYEKLKSMHYSIMYLNSFSTIEDVQSAQRVWETQQVLVCCDMNLSYVNVMNATWLINYSLPNRFSIFNMRFVTMTNSYDNMFLQNPLKPSLRVDIFVDEENVDQLPKLLDFIHRCGNDIPVDIKTLADEIFSSQDKKRANKGINICDELLSYGKCTNLAFCSFRHSIIDRDVPEKWIPSSGRVVFKVLAIHRPDLLSVQLIESTSLDGVVEKYDHRHVEIAFKMTAYFNVESNVRAHGHVEENDIAAIKVANSVTYERCKVVKICTTNRTGGPDTILINLLESEIITEAKAYELYYLPDHLKNIVSSVVRIRITGLKPNADSVDWSYNSVSEAKTILTDRSNKLFNRANIVLAIGNTLFVQTIQCCQKVNVDNIIEVKINYCEHLISKKLVGENPCHLELLRRFCDKFDYKYPTNKKNVSSVVVKKSVLPEPQWAHLNDNEYHSVYICSTVAPDQFYIREVKQQDFLDRLTADIQVYVENRKNAFIPKKKKAEWTFEVGAYCLARFPDDEIFYRARIQKINAKETDDKSKDTLSGSQNYYECFFVDFGDSRLADYKDLCPISPEFITRLPFLAVECRLFGVKPTGDTWNDASGDLLYDLSFKEMNSEDLKLFYARYYMKEIADKTLGKKYALLLYDSNSIDLINNALLAKDLAVNVDGESSLVEKDKDDFREWLNSQYMKNVLDDDFDTVSNASGSIPDFILKNNINCAHSTSLSSFSDLSDAENNSELIPYKAGKVKSGLNNFDVLDVDAWDVQFDKEDYENVMLKNSVSKLLPKIEEDFDGSNASRKNVTITEITDVPDLTVTTVDSKKDKPVVLASKKTVDDTCSNEEKPVWTSKRHEPVSNKITNTIIKPSQELTLTQNEVQSRVPRVLWHQTETEVILKIKLIGVQKYTLDIDDKLVTFETILDDVNYQFRLELYSYVSKKNCSHQNVGSYIRVRLFKLRPVSWLQLMNCTIAKLSWASYDPDHITECSDEELEETKEREKSLMEAQLDMIQRVHRIEMDVEEDSDEEVVNNDLYAAKIKRKQQEVMPFELQDVCPDPKVLADPLNFHLE